MIADSAIARVARGANPVCFAVVMATGIVSAALRQAGLPGPSAALLAIAATSFVVLAAVSCWRAVLFPADLRSDLMCPDRAFACFAFVAACGVLGNGLAAAGHVDAAVVLAGAALAAWLALTCLIPARLTAQPRGWPPISAVNGTWYLWTAGTQSLAIAAAFVQARGLLPPGLATLTARCLRPSAAPRYRPQAWAVVFPLGMYAMAGLQLGTAARLPLIHQIGAAAVWPATAAWAVTFTAMAVSPFTRRRHNSGPLVGQERISR